MRLLCSFLCLVFWIQLSGQKFYDPKKLHDISITFETENWDSTLHALKEEDEGDRTLAVVMVNGTRFDSVGVRYKGNSSYHSVRNHAGTKLPFNVKLDYKIKSNQLPGGYKKLKLSNIFRDPSYVREVLSYEIARKYTYAPQAGFAKVTVNNEYLGIYNVVESIDEDYVEQHFGATDNALIKCDPISYSAIQAIKKNKKCKNPEYSSLVYMGPDTACYIPFYELKTDEDSNYYAFVEMIEQLNKENPPLVSILDIDQVLWMHAFNAVLVNLDSYIGRLSHNYYFYQKDGGQFMPLLWDLNLSFGGFRYLDEGQPLKIEAMQKLSIFSQYENSKRPLIAQVLKNPLFRKTYVAHVKTILEENFANGWYKSRGKEIRGYLDYAVRNEKNALYDYEAFKSNFESSSAANKTEMVGLVELMEARTAYLSNHPLLKKESPTISRPSIRKGTEVEISVRVQNATNVHIFYELEGQMRKMETLTQNGDTYSITLPKEFEKAKYFLIAESEKTASVYPKRGSREMLSF